MNPMTFRFRAALLAAPLLLLVAALTAHADTTSGEDRQPMLLPVQETPLTIKRNGETVASFEIEVADDGAERARGLMFRNELPDDRAMLFVFPDSRQVYFWMENTPRPLDILFATPDGEIITIAKDTTPFSRDPISSGGAVRYVLEINAGLADRLGIAPGDTMVQPLIGAGQGG